MGLGSFIWYGGGAGVAVLYSVVVGAVREFWVKTKKYDVKVHEIPLQTENIPTTTFGNTVGSSINSGTITSSADIAFISARRSQFLMQVDVTANYISGFGSGTATPFTTGARVTVSAGNPTGSNSTASVVGGDLFGLACRPIGLSIEGTANISASVTYTILEASSSITTNPYESWISGGNNAIYGVIKHSQEILNCTFDETPTLEFTDLALIDLPVLVTATYSNGDIVTTRPGNWRQPLENFLRINDQPPSGSSCIDNYLGDNTSSLESSTLYRINLNQTISGQTLRTLLETSPDTVTATLTTQTATSGETCTLGTATESTVQVPSPGRGTIEGITYLP